MAVGAGVSVDRALRQFRSIWRVSHVEESMDASFVDEMINIVDSADIEFRLVVGDIASIKTVMLMQT